MLSERELDNKVYTKDSFWMYLEMKIRENCILFGIFECSPFSFRWGRGKSKFLLLVYS